MNKLPPALLHDKAEVEALASAVAQARADTHGVPHEIMRRWLLQAAEGDFSAPPPPARKLQP